MRKKKTWLLFLMLTSKYNKIYEINEKPHPSKTTLDGGM